MLYVYKCKECGEESELFSKVDERNKEKVCPICGGKANRINVLQQDYEINMKPWSTGIHEYATGEGASDPNNAPRPQKYF